MTDNLRGESLFYLAWSWFYKVGPSRAAELKQTFSCLAQAFVAKPTELLKLNWDKKLIDDFLNYRSQTDVNLLPAKLKKFNLNFCAAIDPNYPTSLKQIPAPPLGLYYQGNLEHLNGPCLGLVGSRRPSAYGQRITTELSEAAAQAGLTIISGLAYGIDAIGHLACLKTGGRAVAILAGGLNNIYPTANRQLAQKIINQGGLLLSEYPPGTAYLKQHFPLRNRLIAGLSQAILITEATLDSGSLITAKLALDFNKEVAAVPGSVYTPTAQGCLELIKQGAKTITSPKDLLEIFNLNPSTKAPLEPLSDEEKNFLNLLPLQNLSLTQIKEFTNLTTPEILTLLSLLELKGYVKALDGENFSRLY